MPKISAKLIAIFLVVLISSAGAAYAISANSSSKKTSDQNCQADQCVQLTSSGAVPNEIYVKLGTTVQFNSADGKTHSLSLGKGGEGHEHIGNFFSGDFGADEAWRVQFEKLGTFEFHDHYNPGISILVVVYKPGGQKIIR